MKKLVISLFLTLPLVLMASAFGLKLPESFREFSFPSRAWKIDNIVNSGYYDDEWYPESRMRAVYASEGSAQVQSYLLDYWDDDDGSWVESVANYDFIYNAAGRVVSSTISFNWGGELTPVAMLEAEYDDLNRITNLNGYSSPVPVKNQWIPQVRFHILYGAGTFFEVYTWTADMEKDSPYGHVNFTFDNRGRIIQQLEKTSVDSINWVDEFKTTIEYHPQDNSDGHSTIDYFSQVLPMSMISDEEIVFPGAITYMEEQDYRDGEWVMDSRTSITYDNQLKRLLYRVEYYTEDDGWRDDEEKNYVYYDNGQLSHVITKIPQEWMGPPLPYERSDYFWQEFTDVDDPIIPGVENALRSWPNPFKNHLNIMAKTDDKGPLEVDVYNIKGQLVQRLKANGGKISWDTSLLPSGVYLLKSKEAKAKVLKVK